MNVLLMIFRQVAAALAAWLVQWGAAHGMTLDEATLVALMVGTFGIVAQGLKAFTTKRGEIPPGGVAADTTEAEKRRVGQTP